MKQHFLFFLLLLLATFATFSQNSNTMTSDNFVSQVFSNVFIEMPDYRETNSGSKLVINFEGEWPAEMQGAFEYAVKMWEEVLPMTLPIHITAKIDNLRGATNILSRVTFDTYDFHGPRVDRFASPMSMIKSVLLQEYHCREQFRFYDEITDTSLLEGNDITITYNSNMIGLCDFALDGTPSENKYDFVTVALRDIAIGLGFTTNFTADATNKKFNITNSRLTPFESLVWSALKTNDPYIAFANATKGKVQIPLQNFGNVTFDSLDVYAPHPWVNGISLRFLISNDNNPITKLLTYDFGKGYVMRDLSGVNWDNIFCGALDWRRDITTSSSGMIYSIGTSHDVFPFKGPINLYFSNSDIANFENKELAAINNHEIETISLDNNRTFTNTSISDFCKKYDSYSPSGPCFFPGISLSVLKKDGSWDCVYKIDYNFDPITINIETLNLNFSESEYAPILFCNVLKNSA